MSMHTPGPWSFVGPFLNSPSHTDKNCVSLLAPLNERGGQRVLGHIYFSAPNEPDWEVQFRANARLIAAAPDLLDVLKICRRDPAAFDDERFRDLVDSVIARASAT